MRRAVLTAIGLAGCASAETRRLDAWVAVYGIRSYRLDEVTCGSDGPEREPPAPFLVVDAVARADLPDTVNLRLCASRTGGCGAPWFSFEVERLTERTLEGTQGEYALFPNATCTLRWAAIALDRDAQGDVRVEIQSYGGDVRSVETEEACVAALEDLAETSACTAFHVLDAERLPDP